MRPVPTLIGALALTTALPLGLAQPAAANPGDRGRSPGVTVRSTQVAAPFNLHLDRGRLLVADGGRELIGRVQADGGVETVVGGVTGASGVATSRDGRYLAYTSTVGGPPAGVTASGLTITGPDGFRAEADTLAYEQANNPDGGLRYGVENPDACVRGELNRIGVRPSYPGLVDSHAYSVAAYRGGWVVADAGANALLSVSRTGRIRTLAVLPAHPLTITAAVAANLGLADCVVGVTYRFESVPTDVEVGPGGHLYVTTLPGGPEDPSLGARGKVFKVTPWTGKVRPVAAGLMGATNLAISRGKLYVTELFAGRVALVSHGRVRSHLPLPGALAIEAGPKGTLYAGTGITGPASVVQLSTSRGWRR